MAMKQMKPTECQVLESLREAVAAIRKQSGLVPESAVILGTGLGNLAKKIEKDAEIPYGEIPYFPVSTVESHSGKFILGKLGGKNVVAMEGRFHFYEGYDLKDITFPVRVMKELGANNLMVSNAAGGINLDYQKGDIVILDDFINFMGVNPLIGPNDERLGPRFPDMSAPFSHELRDMAKQVAQKESIRVHDGVYIGVPGPNLETRAEYRMMRAWGADVVGMSTVPEVIVGVHMGMKILGLSVVTDLCDPDHLEPVDIKEIIQTANEAGPKLDKLIQGVIERL